LLAAYSARQSKDEYDRQLAKARNLA